VAVLVATQMQHLRGSCSTDVVLTVVVSAIVQLQQQRSSFLDSMSDIKSIKDDASESEQYATMYIARTHSSLRGSVDLG